MTYTEVEFDFCPSCQELSGWCTCPGRRTAAATNGLVQQRAQVAQRLIREHQLDEPADREPPADEPDEPGPTVHQLGVAAELRRLRIQQEARRELVAETLPPLPRPAPVLLSELLAEPDEPTAYRIDGLLPTGGRVVLAAQYKAGKTTLMGNAIRSLVDGDRFLGVHEVTPTRRRVVALDTEMGRKTLRRWLRDQRISDPERVGVVALRGRVSSFDVLDPAVRREWADEVRALDPGVLILDCLRPVLDALGLDESHDAGRVLVALDEIAESAGVGELIVVHHMGHSGERSRGDSRLRDWPDVEWRLVREDANDPGSRRFFSAYGRDVEVAESALDYDPDTRHLTLAGGSRKDAAAEALIPGLVELLTDQPGLSGRGVEEVLTETGVSRAVVREALKIGVRAGKVRTTPGTHNATLYWATRAPQDHKARRTEPVTSTNATAHYSETINSDLASAPDDPDRINAGQRASSPVRRSAPPVRQRTADECASALLGSAAHSAHSERSENLICPRCNYPTERLVPPDGLCERCAYPAGGAPDDDADD